MSRDLSEKGSVPARYWALWLTVMGAAIVLFYVVLTPVWFGLRVAAWMAEFEARRREHVR